MVAAGSGEREREVWKDVPSQRTQRNASQPISTMTAKSQSPCATYQSPTYIQRISASSPAVSLSEWKLLTHIGKMVTKVMTAVARPIRSLTHLAPNRDCVAASNDENASHSHRPHFRRLVFYYFGSRNRHRDLLSSKRQPIAKMPREAKRIKFTINDKDEEECRKQRE